MARGGRWKSRSSMLLSGGPREYDVDLYFQAQKLEHKMLMLSMINAFK